MNGSELKKLRGRLSLSQAALAERVGVSANTVARWERDELSIPIPAARLLRKFGDEIDSFPLLKPNDGIAIDEHHEEILRRLDGRLDPDIFEHCVVELLREVFPGVAPVSGGSDQGFDGMIPNSSGPVIPVVTTTSREPTRNLRKNLRSAQKQGWRIQAAVFVSSHPLQMRTRSSLFNAAEELNVKLHIVYDRTWVASGLYRRPELCKALLGLSGKPSALSRVPQVGRQTINDHLIGRESEFKQLLSSGRDVVVVGRPAVGKTHLLRAVALEADGYFVVPKCMDDLPNALRAKRPSLVIIDDAHVDLDRVSRVRRACETVGIKPRVIAASWSYEAPEVVDAMGVAPSDVVQIGLVDRDVMLKIVKDVGLTGSNHLLQLILDHADGRPGVAVTLASLSISHSLDDVVSGAALLGRLSGFLSDILGREYRSVLGPIAIGGDQGVRPERLAGAVGENLMKLNDRIARLASAGVIEQHGNAISVWPEALRSRLVKEVFFDDAHAFTYQRFLNMVESRESALLTLIGARSLGAPVSDLEPLMEAYGSSAWESYAYLGPREAAYVLQHHEEQLLTASRPLLTHQPKRTLAAILDLSAQSGRVEQNEPMAPISKVRDWLMQVPTDLNSVVEQRRIIVTTARDWYKTGRSPEIAMRFMSLALNPFIEFVEPHPGATAKFNLKRGVFPTATLEMLRGLWHSALDIAADADDRDGWKQLEIIARSWVAAWHETAEDVPKHHVITSIVKQMILEAVEASSHSKLLRRNWCELGNEVDLQLPYAASEFDVLFPRREAEWTPEGLEECQQQARNLARKWSKLSPEEIVGKLQSSEEEASLAGIAYPRETPTVCRELAEVHEEHVELTRLLLTTSLAPDLASPFLERMLHEDSRQALVYLNQLLRQRERSHVAVEIILRDASVPESLVSTALEAAEGYESLIETMALRGQIPTRNLQLCLSANRPEIALASALGEWCSNPRRSVRPEVEATWRSVILGTAESWTWVAHSEVWLDEILKSNPDLAKAWILRLAKLRDADYLSYRVREVAGSALEALPTDYRGELVNCWTPHSPLQFVLPKLVGRDPEVYEAVLQSPHLSDFDLAPLEGPLTEELLPLVRMALNRHSPERVFEAITLQSSGWVGKDSDRWARVREEYASLVDHDDPLIGQLGKEGIRLATEREEGALRAERSEAIHGFRPRGRGIQPRFWEDAEEG